MNFFFKIIIQEYFTHKNISSHLILGLISASKSVSLKNPISLVSNRYKTETISSLFTKIPIFIKNSLKLYLFIGSCLLSCNSSYNYRMLMFYSCIFYLSDSRTTSAFSNPFITFVINPLVSAFMFL